MLDQLAKSSANLSTGCPSSQKEVKIQVRHLTRQLAGRNNTNLLRLEPEEVKLLDQVNAVGAAGRTVQ
jgi:hypothetical protein